jgi:ParB/RepB/Spo0J family partition protein
MTDVTFRLIPLGQLQPSPFNRIVKEDALGELTESVKAKGVLQPILVRPMGDAGLFEIVAGYRRFRASQAAGLDCIPATIRELTDEEAFDIQLIENNQREDLNPMQEARAFDQRMHTGKGLTPEELAAKINRDKRYVTKRLRLLDLIPEAQGAVESGEIPMGMALVLTRLRGERDQAELFRLMTEDEYYRIDTVREANQWVDHEASFYLKSATFDTAECSSCIYNSANQGELFPVEDGDERMLCTGHDCFLDRTKAALAVAVDEAKARGFKIIETEEEFDKIMMAAGSKEICSPDRKVNRYNGPAVPKRYKGSCMKCYEKHAFYLRDFTLRDFTTAADERTVELREVCLDKGCLASMQMTKQEKEQKEERSAAGLPEVNESAEEITRRLEIKATEFRDRWLRTNITGLVAQGAPLVSRLILYLLITRETEWSREGIMSRVMAAAGLVSGEAFPRNLQDADAYIAVSMVPEDRLGDALYAAMLYYLPRATSTALLEALPEAGVNTLSDIPLDEEYLKSLKSADLPELIAQFGLPIEPKPSWTKGRLVKEILAHGLTGLKTPELSEAFSPKGPEVLMKKLASMAYTPTAAMSDEEGEEFYNAPGLCETCKLDENDCGHFDKVIACAFYERDEEKAAALPASISPPPAGGDGGAV